jgi:hypothetical protein
MAELHLGIRKYMPANKYIENAVDLTEDITRQRLQFLESFFKLITQDALFSSKGERPSEGKSTIMQLLPTLLNVVNSLEDLLDEGRNTSKASIDFLLDLEWPASLIPTLCSVCTEIDLNNDQVFKFFHNTNALRVSFFLFFFSHS